MIIEIRDMPAGAKIKTIDCHITFDDDGTVACVKSMASTSEAPAVTQPVMPQVESRPEKVSSEMQDIEF